MCSRLPNKAPAEALCCESFMTSETSGKSECDEIFGRSTRRTDALHHVR